MSSFKKFLIGFAIALPLVIGLSFMANRLPKIACIWELTSPHGFIRGVPWLSRLSQALEQAQLNRPYIILSLIGLALEL